MASRHGSPTPIETAAARTSAVRRAADNGKARRLLPIAAFWAIPR
jgi:hypothetical protein